jgi:hypothetical protein
MMVTIPAVKIEADRYLKAGAVARQNAKRTQLREQVRKDLAIVAVDLAAGEQAAVTAHHDLRVPGRRKFQRGRPADRGDLGFGRCPSLPGPGSPGCRSSVPAPEKGT